MIPPSRPVKEKTEKDAHKFLDSRRLGREFAMQFLFQFDIMGDNFNPQNLKSFWTQLEESKCYPVNRVFRKAAEFAESLILGTIDNREEIDKKISEFAEHWALNRMAIVDRNVLRVAIYEMLFRPDIPPIVSINEAIEVAKAFSGEDSGSFINGILNGIKNKLQRPAREALKK